MTIRHLTHLGALFAVALSALGCGGGSDGLSTGDTVRLAYPLDHLVERVAMPPLLPETLGGKAITDMLRDGIDTPAAESNGRPDAPRHEAVTTGAAVTEGATVAGRRAVDKDTRAALAADDFAFSYHLAHGYDAWVEIAFFPPEAVTSLSGRGATATWRGRLVAQDREAGAESAGTLLTGNASITARLVPTAPEARTTTGTDHLSRVDITLTGLTRANGEVARVPELTWSELDLMAAAPGGAAVTFHKNGEISGLFYDGDDVMGRFDKEAIAGVFRAAPYRVSADAGIAGR